MRSCADHKTSVAPEVCNGERVSECIGIFEWETPARGERATVVDEAIVIPDPAKDPGVDHTSWTEPSTANMYVGDSAAGDADIEDLDSVSRDAVGERGGSALVEGDVIGRAWLTNSICYMVIGLHISLNSKQNQHIQKNISRARGTMEDALYCNLEIKGSSRVIIPKLEKKIHQK